MSKLSSLLMFFLPFPFPLPLPLDAKFFFGDFDFAVSLLLRIAVTDECRRLNCGLRAALLLLLAPLDVSDAFGDCFFLILVRVLFTFLFLLQFKQTQ